MTPEFFEYNKSPQKERESSQRKSLDETRHELEEKTDSILVSTDPCLIVESDNDFILQGRDDFGKFAGITKTVHGSFSAKAHGVDENQFTVDAGLMELSPGAVLAQKYRLQELIGHGGMGEIWKAWDIVSDKPVALKFVLKDVKHFEQEVQRVRQMFACVHNLSHQHICQLYSMDFDEVHGFYLVMAWMEGETLHQLRRSYLFRNEPFPRKLIIPILVHIAEALDYAHQNNVVHRDVKAANIFVRMRNGLIQNVSLFDFGLVSKIQNDPAKLNHIETSGTFSYMPPEQWLGEIQDAKTDQYSLAVVAYLLYAGHLPFRSNDSKELRKMILNTVPEPIPDLPHRINEGLLKALSKNKEDRFNSCIEFITALDPDPYSDSYAKLRTTVLQRSIQLFLTIKAFILQKIHWLAKQ